VPLQPLSERPFNGEAPLRALRDPITPLESFYVRSNFVEPELDPTGWRLRIGGTVGTERDWSLTELQEIGGEDHTVTLECAGNGRSFLVPPAPGTPWTLGATGTAIFTGVPLARVLDASAARSETVEWLFSGADRGSAEEWGDISFQRSLPIAAIRANPGPMLVWGMNGRPLSRHHGGPVRLVVPGWYAVASVKWLVRIDGLARPFEGRFQTDRYLYVDRGRTLGPVTRMRVRSLILTPEAGTTPPSPGPFEVSGIAWSGEAPVTAVEVSLDEGRSWTAADVQPPPAPHTAQSWRCPVTVPVSPPVHEIWSRATDATGARQPIEPWRNDLGYGNNQAHRVAFDVG
jgi:DMSO/TMAO reductase YedYZ molybdopterin-dependent catalytic subunit